MPRDLSSSQRPRIRELAGIAYEREIAKGIISEVEAGSEILEILGGGIELANRYSTEDGVGNSDEK